MSIGGAPAVVARLIGLALLAALGVYAVQHEGSATVVFFGLLLIICVSFAVLAGLFNLWFSGHRPAPVTAVAPSGRPAVFFRRSSFAVVMGLLGSVALGAWCVAAAVALYRNGLAVLALPFAVAALLLAWAVLVAVRGMIKPGGLWLTEAGVEYRNEAMSWAVGWPDVLAVVPDEPVLLHLRPGGPPVVHRTVGWIWNRESPVAEGFLSINSTHLAGGAAVVSAMIEHYRTAPPLRKRLGTAESLPPPGMA
jgi:hypothetical protein